jgi:hypothetical protein
MTVAGDGGIFVSYRRQESSHLAGRLHDYLAYRFGDDQVFIDVDRIEPGVDFAEEIFRAVAACKVLLAIIGPTWLTATDERDRRRLDDPDDIVRLEIEAALARNVRVIPILMETAVMPSPRDLPESLAGLARRNALPVRYESFRSDVGRLVTAIERVLAVSGTAKDSGVAGARESRPAGYVSDTQAQKSSGSGRHDAARAFRLFAEAERIATSITVESWKAAALSYVAQVLAATDPNWAFRLTAEAEHIAASITDESSKAAALSYVVRALAAIDPDRAEHIAASITDESSKATALSYVARALAAIDPDRAEHIAASITDKYGKADALSYVAHALAATDRNRASRLFADAERTAASIPEETGKAAVLSHVAQALAATDPNWAFRLFADAEHIAASSTDESSKAVALSHVARALAATDPDRAERIAASITDEWDKAPALNDIARALAATDPDRAERIATSITSESWRAVALSHVAQAIAATS